LFPTLYLSISRAFVLPSVEDDPLGFCFLFPFIFIIHRLWYLLLPYRFVQQFIFFAQHNYDIIDQTIDIINPLMIQH
jgi:hypothetical protein